MTAALTWWCRWWWCSWLLRLQTEQAWLEAALERLSISETTLPNAIPYRDLIPGIARQLTIMRRDDDPITRPLAQLKPIASRLRGLAQGEVMADPAGGAQVDVSSPRPSDHLPFPLRLQFLSLAAEAGELAQKVELHLSEIPRRPRARPKHTAAPRIATYLCIEFGRLTGNDMGRSRKEFTTLVDEIFEILGVSANPKLAARLAEAAWMYEAMLGAD